MKKITFLTTVLALFAFLALPMGMWGQSDYSMDYTGNITLSTTGGSNATNCKVLISNTEYNGIKAGTGSKVGAMMITVPANTKYLHLHVAAWNGENSSALAVTPEGYSENIALTSNSGISGNSPFTFSGDPSTSDYYKVITFTTALEEDTDLTFTATGGKRFVIWGVTSEEEGSGVATPTFNPANGTTFGDEGLEVSIACATDGAIIYYTTDGEVPTNESTVYNEPFTITETTTVKAIAYVDEDASGVASATYTYVDPNAPGSLNNPYTVAQARAAIDAGTGVNGVYATGIVSEIVDPYSSQFLNVTFNMVDAEGDVDFLQAYRCGGNLAPEVALGDVVVVYGNLIYYGNGSLYEFAQGCQVVTVTHPVAPVVPSITVDPAMVNVDAEEHDGTLAITYENLTITDMSDFDIQYYDAQGLEASEPEWIEVLVAEQDPEVGEGYVVSYYMIENEGEARMAYFKVYAMDDETNLVYSNLVTINQEAYVAPALDYATLPFEFNGGKADIEGTDGLTAEGLGNDYNSAPKLRFDGTGDWLLLHFEGVPGELAFDIKGNSFSEGTFTVQTSEDGETYTDFATYTELGATEHEVFNNLGEDVRYIKWIYTEKVNGNVALGNITLAEYVEPVIVPSITFDPDVVDLEAATQTIQIPFTYENIVVTNFESFTVHHYDAEGEEIQLPETPWYISGVTGTNDNGYNLTVFVSANEGEDRSAYMKVSALDAAGNTVYSNLITINQEEYVAPIETEDYAVFTGDLIEGDYLIVYNGYAMNNVVTSGRLQYEEVEPENDVISTNNAAIVWHIARNDEGYWTIYSAAANAYAAGTGVKNKAQMLEDGTDAFALWTVEGLETFEFVNKGNSEANVNANLRNNGAYGFACYSTATGGALTLYKKVTTTASYTLNITGYQGNEGGYYLIASPVYGLNPANVEGMLEGEFDLYAFDQAQNDQEWRNYKAGAFQYLSPGRGYLYAHYTDVELTITGMPYEGNGKVALDYVEGVNLTGWNLIGNPFDEDYGIYIGNDSDGYAETNFYVMNENGDDFELAERSVVHPMEGILVEATAAGQFALFSNETGAWGGDPIPFEKLNIRVSDENGKGDFARIRFGEGNNLEKFMLNPENTKIYFPVDNEEYAVVYTDNMGEMPLNFSAAADGTYTLNINPEDMEMEYLHLIDNMTGMDVDLLANPTYSFEATTNDNAARFTLVFAGLTGIEENSDNFAFFSNGNVIVSNEGNAMLQVVDMNGRIVKSENINGTTSVSVEAAPGVYMLRLVNGDNMKVQKIIVK